MISDPWRIPTVIQIKGTRLPSLEMMMVLKDVMTIIYFLNARKRTLYFFPAAEQHPMLV